MIFSSEKVAMEELIYYTTKLGNDSNPFKTGTASACIGTLFCVFREFPDMKYDEKYIDLKNRLLSEVDAWKNDEDYVEDCEKIKTSISLLNEMEHRPQTRSQTCFASKVTSCKMLNYLSGGDKICPKRLNYKHKIK